MSRCWGLIPARGGSKGVIRKNIRVINGTPLIGYSIKAALDSETLAGVVVSTDDEEIAQVAKDFGAQVPFFRPPELSSDNASDFQVISHFADWLGETNTEADSIAYLRPTTPLKSAALIDRGVGLLLEDSELTGIRSVTAVEGVHHPYWMCSTNKTGLLTPFIEGVSLKRYYQRQMLPPCYRLNGVCDILRLDNLTKQDIYGERVGMLEVPLEQSLDIDTELDLKWFEFLLQQGLSHDNVQP